MRFFSARTRLNGSDVQTCRCSSPRVGSVSESDCRQLAGRGLSTPVSRNSRSSAAGRRARNSTPTKPGAGVTGSAECSGQLRKIGCASRSSSPKQESPSVNTSSEPSPATTICAAWPTVFSGFLSCKDGVSRTTTIMRHNGWRAEYRSPMAGWWDWAQSADVNLQDWPLTSVDPCLIVEYGCTPLGSSSADWSHARLGWRARTVSPGATTPDAMYRWLGVHMALVRTAFVGLCAGVSGC